MRINVDWFYSVLGIGTLVFMYCAIRFAIESL